MRSTRTQPALAGFLFHGPTFSASLCVRSQAGWGLCYQKTTPKESNRLPTCGFCENGFGYRDNC
ncbi:MAG TPA: hypothetical protein VIK07_07070 [Bacteroidales bacterium]